MKFIIFKWSFVSLGLIFWCIYLLYRICYKKTFLPTPQEDIKSNVDPLVAQWRNKHAKVISGLALGVLLPIIFIGIYVIVIPFCKDLKYVIRNEYSEFEGVIVNDIKKSNKVGFGQEVIIRNDKEEIKVDIVADDLQRGDFVTVQYLPNSKTGVLLE